MFSQSTDVRPFDQASGWQDPCLTRHYISFARFSVFALLFLTAVGGWIFLALLEYRPYGIQLASMLIYTAAVALYTFSRNRWCSALPAFLPRCPSPASSPYSTAFGLSCCPLHSSDNCPKLSPGSASVLGNAKRQGRVPFRPRLGRALLVPRNRPDFNQSFTARARPQFVPKLSQAL